MEIVTPIKRGRACKQGKGLRVLKMEALASEKGRRV